jgi:hypothetical protein
MPLQFVIVLQWITRGCPVMSTAQRIAKTHHAQFVVGGTQLVPVRVIRSTLKGGPTSVGTAPACRLSSAVMAATGDRRICSVIVTLSAKTESEKTPYETMTD